MNYEELVASKKSIGDMSKEELFTYCNGLLDEIWDFEKEINKLIAESTEWESKFYDEAKKVDKALNYIDGVWNKTNMPTNTKVALRVLDNILKGDDKE